MSSYTDNLNLSMPAAGDTDWADEVNKNYSDLDGAVFSFHFAEDPDNHSGLDFAYKKGVVKYGTELFKVAGSTITLIDDSINYVEIDPSIGTISRNTLGFNEGSVPLYIVTTASGAITVVNDQRSFLSGNNLDVLRLPGDLLYFDGMLYQPLGIGSDFQVLSADSAISGAGMKWRNDTRGIAFSIAGTVGITQKIKVPVPLKLRITGGKIWVGTAPTGANLVCDIHKITDSDETGTTIYTNQANRPTIIAGNKKATITVPDVTDIEQGEAYELQIDTVGSTIAGADFGLVLYGEVLE